MDRQEFCWPEMTVGVCYYPEQWPQTLWTDDIRRMKEAGISTVRVAEFAWTIFEPEEGRFSFDLFDSFLALCEREGMKVIFGTPTATPPAWLTEKYPETLNADINGVLLRHGCRRQYHYNSPVYNALCARIVQALATHYGQHPAIVGWQIDNELNCERDEFYSERDHLAFRAYVKQKYRTLEALNDAWGTVVWNQTYTDFAQVYAPRPVVHNGQNPHMLLDYYRFVSESCLRFAKMQADIIRAHKKPGDFITTNGMFGNLDNHRLMRESLGVYTYDSYPNFAMELIRSPKTSTDLNDRKWTRHLIETRSVCPHFGIMEQQAGAGGWTNRMEMPAPRPGQLTLWAMQSVAQGADFVSFFRWRTACVGSEIYWHGILDYDGRDNRKLDEVKSFIGLMRCLAPVCGAENVAAFALIKDYDNAWDAQVDAWHRRVIGQSEAAIFEASELHHTPYDVVYIDEDTQADELTKYPVAFYPHPVIMSEKRARLLRGYVEQGGTLIIGCRSAYKDLRGHCVRLPQPGLLASLTGTDIRDFTFTSPNEDATFMIWNGEKIETPVFNDILTPLEGTAVLARYQNSYYAGEAALTRKRTGRGCTLHLGSAFTREAVRHLLAYTGIIEPFAAFVTAPDGVEVVLRRKNGRAFLFALNFMATAQQIKLNRPCVLLYTGESVQGEVILPPYGTAVYELRGEEP